MRQQKRTDGTHEEQQNEHSSSPRPLLLHRMRRFVVTFSNRKTHGAYPIQTHTAEGCVSTSGEVAIFTEDFHQRGFRSMSIMCGALEQYGDCTVQFIDDAPHQKQAERFSPLARVIMQELLKEGFQNFHIRDLMTLYEELWDGGDVAVEELTHFMEVLRGDTINE